MILKKIFQTLFYFIFLSRLIIWPDFAAAEEPAEIFTLKQTIESAIAANIDLQSSKEGTKAAQANQKTQMTNFFPTFSATYQYSRNDEAAKIGTVTVGAQKEYTFATTVTQPIFSGFSNLNRYKIADLGLDAAKIKEKLVRQDIIFQSKNIYFSLLKAKKLLNIARETVDQILAQKNVAKNFYEVGMTPLNDLLQAEVELANAQQAQALVQKAWLESFQSAGPGESSVVTIEDELQRQTQR
ncbi:MAG: TolC family protein, partial [Proteobacteria bacterium]|nr:TolC family protein [Pseudomonadota bacterium]